LCINTFERVRVMMFNATFNNISVNYLCNQCWAPLTLWVWIPLRRCILNTKLCDKVCQWLAAGRWFSPGTPDWLHR
jgi:hypothetical protein